MYRLFLYWLPSLARQLCGLALVSLGPAVALCLVAGVHLLWVLPITLFGLMLLLWRYWFYLWRFGRATRGFRTVRGQRAILRHAPELSGVIDAASFLQQSEATLAEFSRQFGFTLKRHLVIFLFNMAADVSRFFKLPVGGCAFIRGDAIVLASSGLFFGRLDEVLRHELAHLFSARWGKLEPPLNGEGFATWLMGTVDGRPIDFHALASLLTDRYLFLTWLTDPAWFFGSDGSSHLLAGSFTGHLIRQFGWERYRGFFERATAKNFESCFTRVFGLSLRASERQWRDELLERRPTFEPELARFIGERRVETAYSAGHVYRCLEEAEALSRTGAASGKVLWYAGAARFYLGDYEPAASLIERALASDDPWVRSRRGDAWLHLGNVYDLMGQRGKAMTAYERVLGETDDWNPGANSTHARARNYLARPFTETDMQNTLRRQMQQQGRWQRRRRRQ